MAPQGLLNLALLPPYAALLQLDEVLLAVDDLEAAVLVDLADIASVEPSHPVRVDGEVFIVLLDHIRVGLAVAGRGRDW